MDKSESIKELAIALNKAQAQMLNAHKKSDNPFFNSTYANLSEVLSCVKEAFTANGLSFTQMPGFDNGVAYVETMIMHISGEWINSKAGAPIGKQNPQGVGDAITYLRRYALAAVSGLGQEDDDGNSNSGQQSKPKANKSQNNEDDKKPWYGDSDYSANLQGMTTAIRNGSSVKSVIDQIAQTYKISNKYRDMIKAI